MHGGRGRIMLNASFELVLAPAGGKARLTGVSKFKASPGTIMVMQECQSLRRFSGVDMACCTRSSLRIVHFLQNGATGAYYRLLSVRTCVNTHKTIRYHTTGHHTTRNSHLKPLPVQHDIIARRHRSHCWSAGRRRGRAPRSPQ